SISSPDNPALERMMLDAPVRVDVVIGEARMPVETLLALAPGDVVTLETGQKDDIEIWVSDRLMARGRLVVADDQLGVTLTEIIDMRV
ncbi:MAG: FliM/FliN family flagellar motor switch protein, partial [Pseudomonadota bacterium]